MCSPSIDLIHLVSDSSRLVIKNTNPQWSMSFSASPPSIHFRRETDSTKKISLIVKMSKCEGETVSVMRIPWDVYTGDIRLRIDSFLSHIFETETDFAVITDRKEIMSNMIKNNSNPAYEMKISIYSIDQSSKKKRKVNDKNVLTNSSINPISSARLAVENEKFSISREFLSLYSEFFTALFFGSFNDKNKDIIDIKDIKSHSFKLFINFINMRSKVRSVYIALTLLEISDRFIVPKIRNDTLSYLLRVPITARDFTKGVEVADQIQSTQLLERILQCASKYPSKLIERSKELIPCLDSTTIQRLFEFSVDSSKRLEAFRRETSNIFEMAIHHYRSMSAETPFSIEYNIISEPQYISDFVGKYPFYKDIYINGERHERRGCCSILNKHKCGYLIKGSIVKMYDRFAYPWLNQ